MIVNMPAMPRFFTRTGEQKFMEPNTVWGYLPQINQWAGSLLQWEVNPVDGSDNHLSFKAIPICECASHGLCAVPDNIQDNGERLEMFSGIGSSKRAAKEKAAENMALSGHCVSSCRFMQIESMVLTWYSECRLACTMSRLLCVFVYRSSPKCLAIVEL